MALSKTINFTSTDESIDVHNDTVNHEAVKAELVVEFYDNQKQYSSNSKCDKFPIFTEMEIDSTKVTKIDLKTKKNSGNKIHSKNDVIGEETKTKKFSIVVKPLKEHICNVCQDKFYSSTALEQHFHTHYKCTKCFKTFGKNSGLGIHSKYCNEIPFDPNLTSKDLKCQKCDQVFQDKDRLIDHQTIIFESLNKNPNLLPKKCSECGFQSCNMLGMYLN